MAELRIGRFLVLFDDVDEPIIGQWSWRVRKDKVATTAYVYTSKWNIPMHRLILGIPKGRLVDHVNFNGLDNRRENLRLCSDQENVWHTRGWSKEKRIHKCPYKGVWPISRASHNRTGKIWEAKIGINHYQKHIGTFRSAEDAAHAYDDYARYLHGRFAVLNFPTTSPKSQGAK